MAITRETRAWLIAGAALMFGVFSVAALAHAAEDCDPPRDPVQRALEALCADHTGCAVIAKSPAASCKAKFYGKLNGILLARIKNVHADYETLSRSQKVDLWEVQSVTSDDVFLASFPDLAPSRALKANMDAVERYRVSNLFTHAPGQSDIKGSFPEGTYYEGTVRNGKMDGYGVLLSPNGGTVRGQFVLGAANGLAMARLPSGQVNVGLFVNNKLVVGVNQLESGMARAGIFNSGSPTGLVEATNPDGSSAKYYIRFDAAARKSTAIASGPNAAPGVEPVSPALPAGAPADPSPPIWTPGLSADTVLAYSQFWGGQSDLAQQRAQAQAAAKAAQAAAAQAAAQAKIAEQQARIAAVQAAAQAKADAKAQKKAGAAGTKSAGGGSGKSCMAILYEYADVINGSNPQNAYGGPAHFTWSSAQFLRLANAVPVCRADAASMQRLRNDLDGTRQYCRSGAPGMDCENGVYMAATPSMAGNKSSIEAAYQRIVAANQGAPSKSAAAAGGGKCQVEQDKLAAIISASTAKQSASDPRIVGAKGTYQHSMWMFSEYLRVLKAYCKSDPSYATLADYQRSYDAARKSCVQLSSDNGETCVPKKMY